MSKIKPANSSFVKPMTTPYMTAAEAILEQLRLWGVRRIYGVVGDSIFSLMDALAGQTTISFIAVKHESVAAMMASAEAKLTGQLGVCIGHMGPGLANLINGLGDAFLDKAPVLAITGQAPLNQIGTFYKQFINQQQMAQSVSSYSQLIVHPDAVMDSLTQAMQHSVTFQSVSHLSIPADVFRLSTSRKPRHRPQMSNPTADPASIQQVAELMQSCKQPMLLVGSRTRSDSEAIQTLAEVWGSGLAMAYGAAGIVPDSHPYMLGGLGEGGNPFLTNLFKQADMVLAIAASWWPKEAVPAHARIVQITGHPMDSGGSIPADIEIIGDIANTISKLMDELQLNLHKADPEWIHQLQQCKQAWSSQNENERNPNSSPLSPSSIIKVMEQYIADDAVIALDEGDSTLWFLRNFRAKSQHVLLSDRWRSMGFGLPAAMAAKLCLPEKQIICITGDGGLEMVLADLLTAVKYGLSMTVVVFNNSTLQMERDKMLMKGLQPEGTELTNPDFVKVAEACGWDAYRIETIEQLNTAFKHSQSGNKPVLLDIYTAKIPYPDFKS